MIKQTLLLAIVALACLVATPATSTAAAPLWDIDYALYIGEETPKWEVWIDPATGPDYLYGTYYTAYDASYYQFKLYEWDLLPEGASSYIVETTYIKYYYLDTYETWNQANSDAQLLESYGYPTKITPVFGGYIYPITASAAETQTVMSIARMMDDDEDDSVRLRSAAGRRAGR